MRLRLGWLVVFCVFLVLGAHAPNTLAASVNPDGTYSETVGSNANTWTNYTDAGGTHGPTIPSNSTVEIACVVQGFRVQDGNTNWYQIASDPWDSVYYVSADAFYNNGATSGSLRGTPFVDPSVPSCNAGSGGTVETTGSVAHTWTNYANAGGNQGPTIGSQASVTIACRLTGFTVSDGNSWWYQIASQPWSNGYYVSADAFYNNGATSGSLLGTPFYDPAVPVCAGSSGSGGTASSSGGGSTPSSTPTGSTPSSPTPPTSSAPTAPTAPTSTAPTSSNGCPLFMIFDSRGSGESYGPSTPISAAYQKALQARYSFGRVALVENPYPAVGVDGSLRNLINLFGAGLGVGPLGAYNASVNDGKAWLARNVAYEAQICSATRIILTGWSQGAQVAGDVYQQDLSPSERGHIAAVALFGDPYFNPKDSMADRGGFIAGKGGILGRRPSFGNDRKVLSYCHAYDPICGTNTVSDLVHSHLNQHFTYASNAPAAADSV